MSIDNKNISDFSSKIGSNNVEQLDPSKFAFYEEIKDLPNNPAKLLIDVREPKELEETGRIPTAINIPGKLLNKLVIKPTNVCLSFNSFY